MQSDRDDTVVNLLMELDIINSATGCLIPI